ncbi:MAG: family 1 glycosylhydrolase [Actinomycetota bacterium]|nr:family 1 glycosylhydrolase [Actinomycetota bacterium]
MEFKRHFSLEELEELLEKLSLPSKFMFGVANAPFQVEGGYNGNKEPLNNWVRLERKGKVERSGEAIRFWTDYPEQLELARSTGINAFRLGIDWSRIQPITELKTDLIPRFDRAAIEAYSDMLAAIMKAGMEPVVTLHHFTHPYWLGMDFWLDQAKLDLFEDFVRVVAEDINSLLVEKHSLRPIKYYVTINEMNGLPHITYALRQFPHGRSGILNSFKALSNMIAGHCRAYDTVHSVYQENGWEEPLVSYNTINVANYYADKFLTDMLNARENGIEMKDLDTYLRDGKQAWDEEIQKCPEVWKSPRMVRVGERALDRALQKIVTSERLSKGVEEIYKSKIKRKLDYLGVDFYDPFLRNMYRLPTFSDIRENRFNLNAEHWEWVLNPRALYHFLKAETINHEGLPVILLENGMAYKVRGGRVEQRYDHATRGAFLQCFVFEAMRALADGVPLRGYFYWTFVDNYEWGSYEPRFGLFTVDRTRTPVRISSVDAWGVYAGKAFGAIISALQTGDRKQAIEAFTGQDW